MELNGYSTNELERFAQKSPIHPIRLKRCRKMRLSTKNIVYIDIGGSWMLYKQYSFIINEPLN